MQQNHQSTGKMKRWIPDQPGAWFMALGPALGGFVIGGPTWKGFWLLAAWALCYCFQFSTARYLAVLAHRNAYARGIGKSSVEPTSSGKIAVRNASQNPDQSTSPRAAQFAARLHEFAVPTLTYLALTALVGIPLIVASPTLLNWAVPLLALAALSFTAAYTRKERTLWGNAVSVACASLMCLISSGLGSKSYPQSLPTTVIEATLAFAASEYASVLFVKTMIREYGKNQYYALSVIYHLGLVSLGFAAHPLWGAVACVLLARAATLPKISHRLKPVYIGLVEVGTSLMNWIAIVYICI